LPPHEKGLSSPGEGRSRAPHQVDLTSPIRVRDESGDGIRCVLKAGEFLFIPAFWWHEIESIDVAVSVNAWWKATFEQCFVDTALSVLRRTPPDPDHILFYLKTVRWNRSLWEAAELARDKGVDWLCSRLLTAAMDADLKAVCHRRGFPPFCLEDSGWSLQQLEKLERTFKLPAGSANELAAFFRSSREVETNNSCGPELSELFAHAQTLRARVAMT